MSTFMEQQVVLFIDLVGGHFHNVWEYTATLFRRELLWPTRLGEDRATIVDDMEVSLVETVLVHDFHRFSMLYYTATDYNAE